MKNKVEKWITEEDFLLESGEKLEDLIIAYQTFGELNEKANNVIWICHALSGDTNQPNGGKESLVQV